MVTGKRHRPWLTGTVLRIGIAALIGLTSACASAAAGGTATTGATVKTVAAGGGPDTAISETGSSLLYPLVHVWAGAYHQQVPGVTVTTQSTGSGAGIAMASAGKADIGASDAYLSSGDLVKNPTLLNIPLAVSAQTIICNVPQVSAGTHLKLDGAVLAGIFDGTITMWNDPAIAALNPGVSLPAIKTVPLHRADSSGDTFLFTSYLSMGDQQWNDAIGYGTTVDWPRAPGAAAQTGNLAMVNFCASTPGCVGYAGVSYLSQALRDGLGEAMLANGADHFTLPTAGAIQDSVGSFESITPPNETISMIDGPSVDGYPLVNYEYAVVSTRQPDARRASAIRAFLNWVITKGNAASYVDAVGFAPLPASVAELSAEQIARIGS
ncbi:MAG TPA: phosphate ABC transporter substrate-binding protein PstS [Trebonia sp.]|jgi:phosphate transport system substrate-binding protein|nr:phosphate ABC transporter substrate-binding protein PstS [Trebonia sp.]